MSSPGPLAPQKALWPRRDSYRGSLAGLNTIFASFCERDWVVNPEPLCGAASSGSATSNIPFPTCSLTTLPPMPTTAFSPETKLLQNVAVGWTMSRQIYVKVLTPSTQKVTFLGFCFIFVEVYLQCCISFWYLAK